MDKFHPGYFGKVGMRHFHKKKALSFCPTVAVDRLWSLVPESVLEAARQSNAEAPVIDITEHGFHKLLGTGSLPKTPVVVKAKFFSKGAEKKINEVGGVCLLTA